MPRNRGRRLAHPLPLSKDIVLCGELTLDPSQPHNNVLPFPKELALEIHSTDIHDVHTIRGTGVWADFGVQLMTFLTAQARALHLDHVEIKVPRGTQYLVRNSETAFKKACGNKDVRDWLVEHVIDEGRKAAMIVGMYTYSNATCVHTHQNQLGGRVSASIPAGTGAVNPAAGAGAAALDYQAFNMPAEQIFAIEYKRVKFKAWTKKKVEEAKLEQGPNRWEVFFGDRSKGAAADDTENIFEFDLENDDGEGGDDSDDVFNDMEDEEDEEDGQCTTALNFEGSLIDGEVKSP
ncbi:hypothetical protein MMC30_001164 [Trapelia coarctata]|nr:hypothetical protein [Trapelia coarctata]